MMTCNIFHSDGRLIDKITAPFLDLRVIDMPSGLSASKRGGWELSDSPYVDAKILALIPPDWAVTITKEEAAK